MTALTWPRENSVRSGKRSCRLRFANFGGQSQAIPDHSGIVLYMRRLFAIFLLVLLPLQFAWAAVGVYCQHETGAAAKHFGHHDHQHKSDVGHGDKADANASGGTDSDCGVCHAGCSAVIFGETQASVRSTAPAVVDDYRQRPNTSQHYQPERPNWAPLA